MAAQQAVATGTLGGTPIANLLIYVLDRRLTGTLVIEDHRFRKSAVSFRLGVPFKVKVAEEGLYLSEVLVDLRLIDSDVALSSFESSRGLGRLHGQSLLDEGLIEQDALAEALGEQMLRKIEWLCKLRPESMYGYYEGDDLLRTFGGPDGATVEGLTAVWRAIRAQPDAAVVDATLHRLGTNEIRLHPHARVARFGFDAHERGFLDVLRAKPQPLQGLLATGLLAEEKLKRVVFALVATRHVDLGAGLSPIGVSQSSMTFAAPRESRPSNGDSKPSIAPRSIRPPASRQPPPPAAKTDASRRTDEEAAAFRREVLERKDTIGSENYYQILGIERDAPTSAVQAAFFHLAKRWHADRIGPELGDVRDVAMRIFAKMSEAHQVLTNEDRRREYERLMNEGGASDDEQEEVQRVLRAATAFQKAEVFARRGNLDEAEKQAQLAVENDPEQPEYVALYADLLSQRPERAETNSYSDVLKMVNEARRLQPDNVKVRLYRARVLRRSGDGEGSYKEFRNITEQDASNVEAAREVRLYEMRRGNRPPEPKKGTPNKKVDPRGGTPQADKGKPGPNKDLLNQDIGQLFGKLFKR
ncbi:MAG TPA: DnaJ domain-containing protein [Polyangiaceae bacterium]|jgi:curved DNA-binding protein CbpA|nr:DnaJ domain-containing protein [Polyangiaceae bacterium]